MKYLLIIPIAFLLSCSGTKQESDISVSLEDSIRVEAEIKEIEESVEDIIKESKDVEKEVEELLKELN